MARLVLAVNSGSSSLKCRLYELPGLIARAYFVSERIGTSFTCTARLAGGATYTLPLGEPTLMAAVDAVIASLVPLGLVKSLTELAGIGHRIVQGGDLFDDSCLLDETAAAKILALVPLAPLHNPANLTCYGEFKKAVPATVRQVAVFDTTLFRKLPPAERYFPLPRELSARYRIQRYGAHGISHSYLSGRCFKDYMKTAKGRLITMHIGSGASLAAFRDGQCIATSMGLTPLGGVMMGTRSGDLDPSVVIYLMEAAGMSYGEVNYLLSKQSGLLGVSGLSNDMRDLARARAEGNRDAGLALDLFTTRLAAFLGSYYVKLGGLDWLVFSGGIFENAAFMRTELVARIAAAFGARLDEAANCRTVAGREGLVSAPDSRIKMAVIPTDEEKMIARETVRVLGLS